MSKKTRLRPIIDFVSSHNLIRIISCVMTLLASHNLAAQQLTPNEIIQRYESQIDNPSGLIATGKITLLSKKGNPLVREFTLKELGKSATTKLSKTWLDITSPPDLNGTKILSFETNTKTNDQWVYLPALHSTKRIMGDQKSSRFLGSEFSYEDLSPTHYSTAKLVFIRNETCKFSPEKNCFVIEAQPTKESQYSKLEFWINAETYLVEKINYTNHKGVLAKTATLEDYRSVSDKTWRPFKITMTDLTSSNSTLLQFDNIRQQSTLSDDDFMVQKLGR